MTDTRETTAIKHLVAEGLDPVELAWSAMIEAISSGWLPDGSRFDDVRLSQIGGMLVRLQSGQKDPVLHDSRNPS